MLIKQSAKGKQVQYSSLAKLGFGWFIFSSLKQQNNIMDC